MKKSVLILVTAFVASGCSTLYDLGGIATRSNDSKSLKQDISFDALSRDLLAVRKMAWAGFSVTFECDSNCAFTPEEQATLAKEIASTSFTVFDREIRASLEPHTQLSIAPVNETVRSPAFAAEVKTESYKTTVGRWLTKLGIGKTQEATYASAGLKPINPSELGWSGEESLAALGRSLGVDGLLVGHIIVKPASGDDARKELIVKGPKIWLFSATANKSLAVAGVKPGWKLEVGDVASVAAHLKGSAVRESVLNWEGIDLVANRFSQRIAEGLKQ